MDHDELQRVLTTMRSEAQGMFAVGVEALISELRGFAKAAEGAIGEISVAEAWTGIERVVRERCEWLRGERAEPPAPVQAQSDPTRTD
jgi:hypothetical protein